MPSQPLSGAAPVTGIPGVLGPEVGCTVTCVGCGWPAGVVAVGAAGAVVAAAVVGAAGCAVGRIEAGVGSTGVTADGGAGGA